MQGFDSLSRHVSYDNIDVEDTYRLVKHLALMSKDETARSRIRNMYEDMTNANKTPRIIITALLSAALDGIKHGNW